MKRFHIIEYDKFTHLFIKLSFCVLVICSCFSTIGCNKEVLKRSGILERHTIIVDKTGAPYLPIEPSNCTSDETSCDDSRQWSTQEEASYLTNAYDVYLDKLIQSAKTSFPNGKQKKLLVFIHGGLNRQESSNERASKLTEQITAETRGEYYPIFVNWNSALLSSYGEHLTSVRQGRADHWAWATSPTYLATDLGRGLLRAPAVWWSLVGNDLASTPSNKDNWFFNFFNIAQDERAANKIAEDLKNSPPNGNIKFWLGPTAPYTFWKDQLLGPATTALTYPLKFASSPWIDALGKSAWENMLRRTDLLFHTEQEFRNSDLQLRNIQAETGSPKGYQNTLDSLPQELLPRINACRALVQQKPGLSHIKPNGALSIFFRKLAKEIGNDYPNWSITLVGHSMGAIIANHILRDFGTCLPIDNIVFMAAASTINSYKDSVIPFMEMRVRQNQDVPQGVFHGPDESIPKVYHLTLHELAETSETNFWNLPPTGSLLVWIDNFLSTPNTPMDRTSGRFTNLMLSLHTTPDIIRRHISIKRFPGGGSSLGGTSDGIPENHSDFAARFRFWEKSCWEVPVGNDDGEKFQNEKSKNCFY